MAGALRFLAATVHAFVSLQRARDKARAKLYASYLPIGERRACLVGYKSHKKILGKVPVTLFIVI
jgi:hypothetical protein